jgi:hypothetical protein
MLGLGVGLADLMERWRFPTRGFPIGLDAAEAACRFARAGLFGHARRLQGLLPSEERYVLGLYAAWRDFLDVVFLADEIDSLLAVLEADRQAAGLARACRDELDLLLILAEFCEDHAMPRAAEQARFFHDLAESAWRTWPGKPSDEILDQEEFEEDEEGAENEDEWE